MFVAGFIGSPSMNLVPAPVVDGGGQDRIIGFRPEHVRPTAGGGDVLRFDARVEVIEYLGEEQLVHLLRKETPLLAKLPVEQEVHGGQQMEFSVPRDKVYTFDAESEERVR
jgi:ABC-type sugar transport system ATPase subunit